jgi:hypothetical protein
MSDRLSLAHAIEDAGIPREKAENMASAIARFVEGNVATKADLEPIKAEIATLRGEMSGLRGDVRTDLARMDGAIERLRSSAAGTENRLLVRLGGWMVVLFGLFFTLLHLWPPH